MLPKRISVTFSDSARSAFLALSAKAWGGEVAVDRADLGPFLGGLDVPRLDEVERSGQAAVFERFRRELELNRPDGVGRPEQPPEPLFGVLRILSRDPQEDGGGPIRIDAVQCRAAHEELLSGRLAATCLSRRDVLAVRFSRGGEAFAVPCHVTYPVLKVRGEDLLLCSGLYSVPHGDAERRG